MDSRAQESPHHIEDVPPQADLDSASASEPASAMSDAPAPGAVYNVRLVTDEPGLLDSYPHARIIAAAVLAAVALFSATFFGGLLSSPDTYAGALATLDAKRDNVMALISSSAGLSTAISAIPDDTGTPIASELADLSKDFLVVLSAIYLEKYALTVLGFVAFRVLVPLGCLLGIGGVAAGAGSGARRTLLRVGAKVAVLGIALFLVVPASVAVSDLIDSTYETSVATAAQSADRIAQDISGEAQDGSDGTANGDATSGDGNAGSDNGGGGLWNPLEAITQVPSMVTDTVTNAISSAQRALNDLLEAFAVMVVTSCVVPLLTLALFLWLVSVILGVNTEAPLRVIKPRVLSRTPGTKG